ncbi:MAG: methyltetrahydrofolate--corrinoid methyltransferase [Chitinivibrionales bacterium]|nr:methyltetrahydrofolate--corrinoid methyltransferase [Chitinivibrionales bacterium]MBD3394754.1 methyltetrahydrofolate--corrinoid methyltransferase [Chitinivibrionales bacterium]
MIIIGERVNATRKSIRAAIEAHDAPAIRNEITGQADAGADYIDLNAGTGSGDVEQEKRDLCWLVDIALDCTEKKLVLDAAETEVIAHAARHLNNRREWMLNSVNAESEPDLAAGLAVAAEFKVPVIALAMDQTGIPDNSPKRIEICGRIHAAALEKGLAEDQLFFDPLVLPISADVSQGNVTFETLAGIMKKFPHAHTTMGLSNVSHGLKKRIKVNSAFLLLSIANGLDSAICDPIKPDIMQAILLGELLTGKDRYCRRFTRALRKGVFDN